MTFEFCEVTGGGYDYAADLRDVGISYRWEWDACLDAYDAGLAYYTPETGEVAVSKHGPCATIREDGTPDPEEVETAMRFYKARKAFENLVFGS